MIIHTGMRTDIPAFYAEWFANRLKDGYVMTRNPYHPSQVSRYQLTPEVVDLIGFCTTNPEPMLSYMELLKPYGMYWFVTITPYGKDIEPFVPDKEKVIHGFQTLSDQVGVDAVRWRYCYANYDRKTVELNYRQHDPKSPLLIGHIMPEDTIHDVKQQSWINGQMSLEQWL